MECDALQTTVVAAQLEVAMAGVEPPVNDLGYRHLALADVQPLRFGIGAVAGVALDPEERTVFRAGFFL